MQALTPNTIVGLGRLPRRSGEGEGLRARRRRAGAVLRGCPQYGPHRRGCCLAERIDRFVPSEEKYGSTLLYTVQEVSRNIGYTRSRCSGHRASTEVSDAGC